MPALSDGEVNSRRNYARVVTSTILFSHAKVNAFDKHTICLPSLLPPDDVTGHINQTPSTLA
jgi:hypothetical protein